MQVDKVLIAATIIFSAAVPCRGDSASDRLRAEEAVTSARTALESAQRARDAAYLAGRATESVVLPATAIPPAASDSMADGLKTAVLLPFDPAEFASTYLVEAFVYRRGPDTFAWIGEALEAGIREFYRANALLAEYASEADFVLAGEYWVLSDEIRIFIRIQRKGREVAVMRESFARRDFGDGKTVLLQVLSAGRAAIRRIGFGKPLTAG